MRRVDWVKVEAISIVMSANLSEGREMGWGGESIELPSGLDCTRRGVIPDVEEKKEAEENERNPRDWAGVEDTEWRGTYCFIDYRTYEHYKLVIALCHSVYIATD